MYKQTEIFVILFYENKLILYTRNGGKKWYILYQLYYNLSSSGVAKWAHRKGWIRKDLVRPIKKYYTHLKPSPAE